ncbi:MAG: aspartate kinase [Candidatus Dadabacteria bacterium]|nr:aspartate kinase [Candidatus Dadabacteria bacterium]
MALVVQKYGGTSVASVEKIRRVAEHIVATKKKKNDVIAVVSAMAGETDRLVALATEVMDPPDEREFDVITSSGEQVSSGLLAMTVKALGEDSVSFQGHQIRIITDNIYSSAKIKSIDDRNIRLALGKKKAVVVAGFQGVDDDGNLTTLGRGGSDLTAVALAAVMGADACELYKDDVDGVYTTDPGVCPDARKLSRISYDEMLEMASLGSKVLQARAVEFAKKFKVPIHVKSTPRPENEGTWVLDEEKVMESMEKVINHGIKNSL